MKWADFVLLSFFASVFGTDQDAHQPILSFLILTQRYSWNEQRAAALEDSIAVQAQTSGLSYLPDIAISSQDFAVTGDWAIWPLIQQYVVFFRKEGKDPVDWLIICEEDTRIRLKNLLNFLSSKNATDLQYFGRALFDKSSTIIHHFAFATGNPKGFLYPDFAGGVVFSWAAVNWLYEKLQSDLKKSDFTIDPKHELAMVLWNNDENEGIKMTHAPEFCTVTDSEDCVTVYRPDYSLCKNTTSDDDVFFAVKTYHENHKTKIVVLKRTWGLHARNIEFFSDTEDKFIPTVHLGIENTERGHCGKTEAILKRFVEKWTDKRWLVIADDDTLLSVPRLMQLLQCYDWQDPVILGERYGYGFNKDGDRGYEYPTGGSGMIFSRTAAERLVNECKCPQIDSPDDMVLGMCARNMKIPVLHSAAFHQARPEDYADDYLKRILPISFHKHWEVDPYKVYTDWLADDKSASNKINKDNSEEVKNLHKEL